MYILYILRIIFFNPFYSNLLLFVYIIFNLRFAGSIESFFRKNFSKIQEWIFVQG